MSHLKLITLYPHELKLQFDFDGFYDTPKADELYKHQPDFAYDGTPAYRDFKNLNRDFDDEQRLQARLEIFQDYLEQIGIKDYLAKKNGRNRLDFYFATENQRAVAASFMVPELTVKVVFMQCDDDFSESTLTTLTASIQKSYDTLRKKTDSNVSVQLSVDFASKAILATAKAKDIPNVLIQAGDIRLALGLD